MRTLLSLFLIFNGYLLFAQMPAEGSIKWWDPGKSGGLIIEGQAWPTEVKNRYDRLPARAEYSVRKEVWQLSRNAAGLKIRFKTNSKRISVRYQVESKIYAMNHFPATGVSGIDLYSLNKDGSWAWANGSYKFGDTISYVYRNLELQPEEYPDGREYHLYLPLYNNVSWLEIGIPETSSFMVLPARNDRPIIVYGTSIAQGGCASRPGMAWTAILERELKIPLINLGFSGNGRLEKEICDLISEVDARIVVFDCLPNLGAAVPSDLQNRIITSVKQIRNKHPEVPILLTEHSGFINNRLDAKERKSLTEINETNGKAFKKLKDEGMKNIYILSNRDINIGTDGTVDGAHPTDLGMDRYAKAYQTIIRRILKNKKNSAF